ncbi:MAG TPA: septation protein A [Chromatiaceae bacterium]|nr:septation protein A [Chromatiaceae bacterium]
MKLFFDFLPVILFFAAYKAFDIYIATATAIVAAGLQVLYQWARHGKPEKMTLWTFILILVLGGMTLIFRNPDFIKWKPTVINWIIALICLGSLWIGEKNVLERMMGHLAAPPPALWVKLTLATTVFFLFIGALNLYVAFNYPEHIWVDFKLFGVMGLTLAFSFAIAWAVMRHAIDESEEQKPETGD